MMIDTGSQPSEVYSLLWNVLKIPRPYLKQIHCMIVFLQYVWWMMMLWMNHLHAFRSQKCQTNTLSNPKRWCGNDNNYRKDLAPLKTGFNSWEFYGMHVGICSCTLLNWFRFTENKRMIQKNSKLNHNSYSLFKFWLLWSSSILLSQLIFLLEIFNILLRNLYKQNA